MAKRKKKNKEELFATELAVRVDSLTLDRLVDHYVHLRFYQWYGGAHVENKPYYVFENMPESVEAGQPVRKSVRFETQDEADAYVHKIREAMKLQLLKSFGEELADGDVDEANPGTGTVGLGSENSPERNQQLATG